MNDMNESQSEPRKRAPRKTKQIVIGFTPRELEGLAVMQERDGMWRSDHVRKAVDAYLTANGAWPKGPGGGHGNA